MTACEVVESADPAYRGGARIVAMARWEDWSVIRPTHSPVPVFRVPE